MTAQITTGMQAPDFDLPSTRVDERVRLSEVVKKGSAVLLFYPSDWGMMCAVEMRGFREMFERFREAKAILLAINTNSVFSHRAWREQMNLQFELLSDFDGKVSASYGVLCGDEGYLKGRSNRAVFVVDSNRIVRFAWVADDPSYEPDYDLVLEAVRRVGAER